MIKLLSHLSHVEITTPDVEESVPFYTQVGLRVVGRDGGRSTCGRGGTTPLQPGDHQRSRAAPRRDRLAHHEPRGPRGGCPSRRGGRRDRRVVGLRPRPRPLLRVHRSVGPHDRLAWDIEQYSAEDDHASIYPDRPEKRSSVAGAPRFLDHVTIAASDVKAFAQWHHDVLGFRIMAYTDLDEAPITVFAVITTNEKSHDLGVVLDSSSRPGRINHYAFWVDTREELLIAADVLMENGTHIEYGPSIHGSASRASSIPRPERPAHRGEHGRLPQLRARLGGQHLEAVDRIEQPLPQQRHADVDDRVLPARRGPPDRDQGGHRPRHARGATERLRRQGQG